MYLFRLKSTIKQKTIINEGSEVSDDQKKRKKKKNSIKDL